MSAGEPSPGAAAQRHPLPQAGEALEVHLGRAYAERFLGCHGGAVNALKAALVEPAMRQAAEQRLEALRQVPAERCFVSARHREFLEAALAAAATIQS